MLETTDSTRTGRILLLLSIAAALAGCPSEEPGPGDLPPDDTPALLDDDDDATAPGDDDDATNTAPETLLSVEETGLLLRSPAGGPYNAITGEMTITELVNGQLIDEDPLDEEPPPTCEVLLAAVGTLVEAEEACSFCDETWAITFSVDEGNPDRCLGPDQPADGEVRVLGFVAAEQALYWNYRDLGQWVWWYHASDSGDELSFEWRTSLGIDLDD